MLDKAFHKSDSLLIADALAGDHRAFRDLFDKYWHDLYRIASRRIASHDDIKDILQDVFVSLWKNLATVKVDNSIGGYLYTALQHKIFNYYESKRVRLGALMQTHFNAVESEDTVYSNLHTKELRQLLEEIVSKMPARMREIYELSRQEQLTHAEIAELLTLAPQTIKNQIHEALRRIREGLEKDPLLSILA